MYDLKIGSVVELMSQEGDIYTSLITQVNVHFIHGNTDQYFKYRGLVYPYGFIGVDTSSHFDDKHIIRVIYNKETKSLNQTEIVPGTYVNYQDKHYMVIGKNVKYLGNEDVDTYACIDIYGNDTYDITYITKPDINVISYGYMSVDYLLKTTSMDINELLIGYNKRLPIGSIVTLSVKEHGLLDVMIINRNYTVDDKVYDYSAVASKLGYQNDDMLLYFNKDKIIDIKYIGHFDQSECNSMLTILKERDIIGGSNG